MCHFGYFSLTHSQDLLLLRGQQALRAVPDGVWHVQQFVPHSALLLKVYVIGDKVHVALRPSLDNGPAAGAGTAGAAAEDTPPAVLGRVSDAAAADAAGSDLLTRTAASLKFGAREDGSVLEQLAETDSELMQRVRMTAAFVRERLALSLFNVDLLLPEADSQQLVLVDVNYLPSYAGVPDAADSILDMLLSR